MVNNHNQPQEFKSLPVTDHPHDVLFVNFIFLMNSIINWGRRSLVRMLRYGSSIYN